MKWLNVPLEQKLSGTRAKTGCWCRGTDCFHGVRRSSPYAPRNSRIAFAQLWSRGCSRHVPWLGGHLWRFFVAPQFPTCVGHFLFRYCQHNRTLFWHWCRGIRRKLRIWFVMTRYKIFRCSGHVSFSLCVWFRFVWVCLTLASRYKSCRWRPCSHCCRRWQCAYQDWRNSERFARAAPEIRSCRPSCFTYVQDIALPPQRPEHHQKLKWGAKSSEKIVWKNDWVTNVKVGLVSQCKTDNARC